MHSLAQLHDAPRAATCTAMGATTAWALDAISFKMILMGKSQSDQEDYVNFITQVSAILREPAASRVSRRSRVSLAELSGAACAVPIR